MSKENQSIFFRVVDADPGIKQIQLLKDIRRGERYRKYSTSFKNIPNSPISYWVSERQLQLFKDLKNFEENKMYARVTNETGDDFRYYRTSWEINHVNHDVDFSWFPLSKGGERGRYYADLHLYVIWDLKRSTYRGFAGSFHRPLATPASIEFFFKAGITWPRRGRNLGFKALPENSLFSNKSPGIFAASVSSLSILLGLTNSLIFRNLIKLVSSSITIANSVDVGIIQNTPYPSTQSKSDIGQSAFQAYEAARILDTATETSHAFQVPWLLRFSESALFGRLDAYQTFIARIEAELTRLQNEIDELAFDLYELSEEDRALIRAEMSGSTVQASIDADADAEVEVVSDEDDEADDEEEEAAGADLATLSQALLSWCVGVAFGRWDVRMTLDATLMPELQGPFERLPVVAPAGLVGVDGYPAEGGQVAPEAWLRARPSVITLPEGEWANTTDYTLSVAWDGILVSDQGGPRDLSTRVRAVLRQVFGDTSDSIEEEALQAIQGERRSKSTLALTLEDYLRQPKHFFATHLKGYSRSRRKAPIYWPLMHKDAPDFAVWVYYPRMDAQTLPRVLTDVVLPAWTARGLRSVGCRASGARMTIPGPRVNWSRPRTSREAFRPWPTSCAGSWTPAMRLNTMTACF